MSNTSNIIKINNTTQEEDTIIGPLFELPSLIEDLEGKWVKFDVEELRLQFKDQTPLKINKARVLIIGHIECSDCLTQEQKNKIDSL